MLENRMAILDAVADVQRTRMWLFRRRIRKLGLVPAGFTCDWPQPDHDRHVRAWRNHQRGLRRKRTEAEAKERRERRQAELFELACKGKIWWGDIVYENGSDRIVAVRDRAQGGWR